MKKHLLGFLAIIVIGISACAQQMNGTTGTSGSAKKTAAEKPAITYVYMQRTPCFGTCPYYSLEMYDNGLVRYTGQMYTEYEGIYEKNIGAATTRDIMTQFSNYRIDTCSETYQALIQDVPGIVYKFKYGNTEKKIFNANFGPDFLSKMASKMDNVAKVDKSWKRVGDVPKN